MKPIVIQFVVSVVAQQDQVEQLQEKLRNMIYSAQEAHPDNFPCVLYDVQNTVEPQGECPVCGSEQ
jgi:hypothetical protein